MMRSLFVVSILALGATAVCAQDPVTTRENLMKANNDSGKILSQMVRGQIPFDVAKVNAAFDQFAETAKQLPDLFPDNAKTGGDNRASPKIWENKADFNAKIAEFAKIVAELKPKAQTLEGLTSVFRPLARSCDNCHHDYRLSKR